MKNSQALKIALALAVNSSYGVSLPIINSPPLPKEKTSGDLDRLVKAEEKRKRKANKRIGQL